MYLQVKAVLIYDNKKVVKCVRKTMKQPGVHIKRAQKKMKDSQSFNDIQKEWQIINHLVLFFCFLLFLLLLLLRYGRYAANECCMRRRPDFSFRSGGGGSGFSISTNKTGGQSVASGNRSQRLLADLPNRSRDPA